MYRVMRKCVETYIRSKFNVIIHNKEKIPPRKATKGGGYIIACNHQFYWDPPVIAAVFKGKFSFMAKSELFEKKMFAGLIRYCGAFPVKRGVDGEMAMQKARADIKNGRIFVIFPEGTRSKDGVIGRGKSGTALIAAMANAPVVPVCIMYGRNGDKKRVDVAVGDMIPACELEINPETRDRKEVKGVTDKIMNAVKDLQTLIYNKTT